MTEVVVDLLEVIHIHHNNCKRSAVVDEFLELVREELGVRQTGHTIVVSELGQCLVLCLDHVVLLDQLLVVRSYLIMQLCVSLDIEVDDRINDEGNDTGNQTGQRVHIVADNHLHD